MLILMMNEPKRLWEVDHPYYCNLGNYFSNDCGQRFRSWAEFEESSEDEDLDLNLVFRWDWQTRTDDNGDAAPHPDDNYRADSLEIFYIGQRKGIYRFVEVEVCRADEPAVRAWLAKRYEHLKKLWEPLA